MPQITAAAVQEHLCAHLASWRLRCSDNGPRLFSRVNWAEKGRVPGREADLRQDLRRVADSIVEEHWLRVYAHNPAVIRAARELLPADVPEYHPWPEFQVAGQIEADAQQELWQRDVGDNMVALAAAARLWEDPKYAAALKCHVLAACEYPTWGANPVVTNMDLSCAHLARGVAIARDWLPELWSPPELQLVRETIWKRAGALLQGAYGAAFWHDRWLDNHCHCALAALGLCGLAFLDEIEEAPSWLAAAQIGFGYVADLAHEDGSSPEGIPYWSYGASFLLQYLEGTRAVTGAEGIYESPYLRNSFNYRLQASTPDLSGTLPFGDAAKHDYYGPSHILHALASQYSNPHAQWLAASLPFPQIGGADCEVWNLLWFDAGLEPEPPSLELDCHLPVWDVAVTRGGWEPDEYALAIKSGFTNRNHSHLDAGTLVLAWGGEWLLAAPGYGRVGPGFWDANGGRWEFYSNSTESHGTLLINGANQRYDSTARGTITQFEPGTRSSRTVIDLTEAYHGVRRVERRVLHVRGEFILVEDEIELEENGTVEWLLQPGVEPEWQAEKLLIRGTHGAIEARMLWPESLWERRSPTQLKVDIPESQIHTHAVAQSGARLRFTCLLRLISAR